MKPKPNPKVECDSCKSPAAFVVVVPANYVIASCEKHRKSSYDEVLKILSQSCSDVKEMTPEQFQAWRSRVMHHEPEKK